MPSSSRNPSRASAKPRQRVRRLDLAAAREPRKVRRDDVEMATEGREQRQPVAGAAEEAVLQHERRAAAVALVVEHGTTPQRVASGSQSASCGKASIRTMRPASATMNGTQPMMTSVIGTGLSLGASPCST